MDLQQTTKIGLDALAASHEPIRFAIGFHSSHRKKLNATGFRRLSLKNNPFLYKIYMTEAQRVIVRKAVQVLQTETFLIKKVILPCSQGKNVLYMLPSMSIARLFVRERIDKLFSRTTYYRHLIQSSESQISNTIMKTIGDGTAMFVGARQETYVEGFPMDIIVYDEYDSLIRQNGQDVVDQAEDREKGADALDVTKLGNPYAADIMIDGEYQVGDQNEWMVKCCRCGHWQTLNWFEGYVRKVDAYDFAPVLDPDTLSQREDIPYMCVKCERPLDRFSPMSQWVPKYPDRMTESYTISRMMVKIQQRQVAREMMEEFTTKAVKDPKRMQAFYRSNLGIGYEASDDESITQDLVLSCIENYDSTLTSRGICLVGGDIKTKWWHFVVGRLEDDYSITVLHIGKETDTKRFKSLSFDGFNVRLALLDAQGMGGRIIREQIVNDDNVAHLVWSVFYRKAERVFRSERTLHCLRDIVIDDVLIALKNGDIRFPASTRSNQEFLLHMTANVKVPVVGQMKEGSTNDTPMFTWKKRQRRDDDFLHAIAYLVKAKDLLVEMYGMVPPSHEHVDGDVMEDVSLFQSASET